MYRRRRMAAIAVGVALLGVSPVVGVAQESPPPAESPSPAESPPPPPAGPSLPEGFEDTLVAGAPAPTALAWTPAGQMLLGTQQGRLYLGTDGTFPETPALDLSDRLCPRLEQGLLGVAAHPDFGTNGWVYVFWTHDVDGCVHRVSRFTMGPSGVADPASEMVLVDNIPSPNGNHNGGDLQFGPDDYLYVSIGDGGCDYDGGAADCAGANDSSRDRHVLQGKILRIGAAGEIPPDNPFLGEDTARCHEDGMTKQGRTCQETFAWGLRNPFRIAFDPDSASTRFFINDVGQNLWEEIDEGIKGADYGWNVREGRCANASLTDCGPSPEGMTDPIHSYPHENGCGAITGGAFVPRAAGWPEDLVGDYLFADYACGTIFRLEPDGNGGWKSTPFITGLGDDSAVHLTFGPSPFGLSLYYTTYGSGGQVRRFDYVGTGARPPRAELVADPAFGDTPLRVTLDAGASRAYGGAAVVRYRFDAGDGSGVVEQDGSRLEHTYQQAGTVTASVTAVDDRGQTSPPATAVVRVGETPPTITVGAPAGPFAIGDEIVLSASGTDTTDGPVPPEKLTWHVLLHHDAHTHPFLGPVTGGDLRFDYPRPESLRAAANSYLEVRVAATDSAGLTGTSVVDLRPRLVELSFVTEPEGFAVTVDGEDEVTPWTVQAWVGLPVRIAASEQTRDGERYRFDEWSDDEDEDHVVTAPEEAVTYTARFKRR
jgi:glucose/arabinose dehydrogenase